jgi:hypothetical protein
MSSFRLVLCAPFFVLLFGCSESPKPASDRKPPEPVSAQSAFYKMLFSARVWAADAQPLRVAEIDVDEVKADGGKAAAWEAVFVSQSQRSIRRFIYSVIHRPARNLRGGVTSDPPEGWSGGGGSEPFLVQAFKKDSPAAYEVAIKKGHDYARKNPAMPVKFVLEKTIRFPDPAWRVFWGESVSKSGYSIFVDATTGEYLATSR